MRRPILFVVLSFLLLFMQQETQVHALSHLGPQLARTHETKLIAPHADDSCVECALLAAGTSGIPGDATLHGPVSPAYELVSATFRSRPADAPTYFQSRAPPVLL